MDLENQAAESGLDTGNAGGEVRNETPREAGLSLKDSLSKAAAKFQDGTPADRSAKQEAGETDHAFETNGTQARSLQGEAGSQEEAAPSILEAPKHWPQKRRDAFQRYATANPDFVRDWLDHTKELEGEFTRKSQEHAEHRKFAETVRELFAPEQRQVMQQNGVSEVDAIKWLTQLDGYARRDPAGYAKWFMQQAGLTPQQLFPEFGQATAQNGQGDPADADWQDPDVIKLREELGSLKAQQSQYQAWIQQQETAQRHERQQTINRTIQQFVESKDESGSPLYPHFAEVEDRMAWELNNNPELQSLPIGVEKLKAAYDLAVWANPTTRQAMLDAQLSAQQQEAQRRQAAERAKAAQTLKPKVASNAGAQKAPPTDLKSLIRDAASRAQG